MLLSKDVFGSMQVLREARQGESSLYNAYAPCLLRLELFGPDGVMLWIALSGEGNRQLPRVATMENENSSDDLEELMKAFESYGKVAPLVFYSRDCVLMKTESKNVYGRKVRSW